MKIRANDCVHLLRAFEVVDEEASAKYIKRLTVSNPLLTNTLVDFRYKNQRYAILFDEAADDDPQYVEEVIRGHITDELGEGSLLENPGQLAGTYGYPYKGKDAFLYKFRSLEKRLDIHLAATHPELSRSSWQKQIRDGQVLVDGQVVTSPKAIVDEDSSIEISKSEKPDHSDKTLPIIYMDDDVIVIEKPAGVLTHAKNELDQEFTVADFFERYSSAERQGIVHRLDRDTSGIMIGARNDSAYKHLKNAFAERTVKKTYLAIIAGALPQPKLRIELPIARNSRRPGEFTVDADGKSAETLAEELARVEDYSLVKLTPRTGRTHQLRVHLSHIGCPIRGDRLYGKSEDRLYLHADSLELTLPSGEKNKFISPSSKEFSELLDKI